jgi:hypothetical protein
VHLHPKRLVCQWTTIAARVSALFVAEIDFTITLSSAAA